VVVGGEPCVDGEEFVRGCGGRDEIVSGQGPPCCFERAGPIKRSLGARQRGIRPGMRRVEVADAGGERVGERRCGRGGLLKRGGVGGREREQRRGRAEE